MYLEQDQEKNVELIPDHWDEFLRHNEQLISKEDDSMFEIVVEEVRAND